MDSNSGASNKLSPYDPRYPVSLLEKGLKKRLADAQQIAGDMYQAVIKEAPVLAQLQRSMQTGFRYVVDATESTLAAIDRGGIKLTVENGNTYAQIRDGNHYGKKLPIKRENFRQGIDPVQMATALQLKALQDQIQSIADQIVAIDQSVRSVLEGQQNDRIGLYYSGLALYLEARTISDNEMRKTILAQAVRALSEASFQLSLTMQSDIRYLANGEYRHLRGKQAHQIDEHMRRIHQSFGFIHQAMLLKAGIYCEQGEIAAMSTVLSEYSYFIEETVAKNAPLLAQCDTSDSGTHNGVWLSRSRLKLDTSELVEQLTADEKVLYLHVEEEHPQ